MKIQKNPTYLSVVIPLFNESLRIGAGLPKIVSYLKKQAYQSEIIIVDDGSIDETAEIAKKLLKQFKNYQLITHKTNQGKGAAIRSGVAKARGAYIIFTDIDLSTPISEIPKLLRALQKHDVAIGVRRHKKSQIITHQPRLRESLGRVFTGISGILVTPGISDTTCGFKGYKKEVARKLYRMSKIDRWAFDAEILFLARTFHFSIAQIPVSWRHDGGTKVQMFSDGMRAFVDLFKIRTNHLSGQYTG